MNWLNRHKNKIFNFLSVAAPIVAGVLSGGVFTIPVLVTTLGTLVGKLAASPLNHDQEKGVAP